MNTLQEIPPDELNTFKLQVKKWLELDQQILELETKSREYKTIKNRELEPQITQFMRKFNISDLNTSIGKVRCNERNTKKPLNKHNIRDNLSLIIQDEHKVNEAMEKILINREVVTTYKLVKPRVKLSIN